ncbi:MAG: response regulator [Alphaproteobacteria bacterium]|nr:response regulator [Alphaproteobacteria bacterium]
MRFVNSPDNNERETILNAVRRDPESWRDWSCMRIEILDGKNMSALRQGLIKLLETNLDGRQGTCYVDLAQTVDVFCKGVQQDLLASVGRQIVELARIKSSTAAISRIYHLGRDADVFLKTFDVPANKAAAIETTIDSGTVIWPEHTDKSDHLSQIDSCKVLLVEDDPVTRWMVKMALKDECRLTVAHDASKAMTVYKSMRPDMVLLDINLPGSNGQEVMSNIMKADPGAYIVMFSSQDSVETIANTLSAGARGFIAKPFCKERLIEAVHNCPARR